MQVLVLAVSLHLPGVRSLKAKRSVVLSAVRTLDGWKAVGAAEVGALDVWQRAEIGVTVVGGSVTQVNELADRVERFVWAIPGVDVLDIDRTWWEQD